MSEHLSHSIGSWVGLLVTPLLALMLLVRGAQAQIPQRTITTDAESAMSVYAADLDQDGAVDVLSASLADDKIAWYENRIGEGASDGDGFGLQETITTDADEAQSVYVTDLNGNGNADVLSASTNDDKVAWYANTDGALPVELVSFEGHWTSEGNVALTWHTVSETNNAVFQIQRTIAEPPSIDSEWTTIGEVKGSGTPPEPQSYRYVDADLPFAADSLSYRLRQVDVDGTVHLAGTTTIERDVKHIQLKAVSPNPARNRVTVRFAVPERHEVSLRIHDVLGREVRTIVDQRVDGRHNVQFDVSSLPSGTYFLRLTAGRAWRTTRFTVVR